MRLMVMDCTDMDLERILPLLDPRRRELALGFAFPKDRRLSAGAGLFMRYLESEYGPITPVGPNVKPRFVREGMDFNISHSGNFVICAVSDRTVGADIETVGRNQDLAKAVMRPRELEIFLGSDEEHREELFARIWTVKESYMKEYGKDTIEIHSDAITEKDIVLIHDDLLATGGSMLAAYNLVQQFNPKQTYINFIIELTIEGLNGMAKFPDNVEITTLIKI